MAFLCTSIPEMNVVQAASKPKLSTKNLSLTVGQSKKITVKGTTKTVKWSSSNKKIVTVAKAGKMAAKVTAKKAGTAQVSAKVSGKVLKCKVLVKKSNQETPGPTTKVAATSTPGVPNSKVPNVQTSATPAVNASAQPVAGNTMNPITSPTADPSNDKGLAQLVIDENTVTHVTNKYTATYAIIPDGVTSIRYDAFFNCRKLKSITIPKGLKEISFSGCSSLESITIPEGVTSIDKDAFSGCSSLESITIPEGVTSIGKDAFSGCRSLENITIPERVTTIGDYAFYDVLHIEYHGTAKGEPWGALFMN